MEVLEFKSRILEMGQTIKSSIEKIIEPLVASEGLTTLQTMILIGIQKNVVNNVGSLSKQLGLGQANASAICKRMEKTGFLTRARDKDDERIVKLYITQKAAQALSNLNEKSEALDPILQTLPSEKFDEIIRGFDSLQELLVLIEAQKNN